MRFFRTTFTGAAVFGITPTLCVIRIGPFEGNLAQSLNMWPSEGIYLIEVPADVADWLGGLP